MLLSLLTANPNSGYANIGPIGMDAGGDCAYREFTPHVAVASAMPTAMLTFLFKCYFPDLSSARIPMPFEGRVSAKRG
jgi:hypothetical protein